MSVLYRALLLLFPASFRNEYGDELTALFMQRVTEEGRIVALLQAIADVVPNALAIHGDILAQDLRFAGRAMRRAPGFVVTAVLVVALGVGANTAAFTLADFVLIRPLPFPEQNRMVKIWERTPGYARMESSAANYRDVKTLTTSFAGMAAYTTSAANLVGAEAPRRLATAMVTFDLMPLLRVNALLGRTITTADSLANPVAVLSYAVWQSQFGSDASVIGRQIRLDGTPRVVVGVMPPTFNFPSRETEVWVPLVLRAQQFTDRNDNWLEIVARLRPGVSLDAAKADIGLVWTQLARRYPKELENTGINVLRLRDELPAKSRTLLLALCGAAMCILLLACANLASLLLARAIARGREIAVRAALGAGRERIVRQLATESILLAVMGGVAGILVARAAIPALARLVPESLPIAGEPALDGRILLFAALIVVLTGLAFGIVPALRAGGSTGFADLRAGVRAGGGRKQPARGALVAIEIAASVVLLICSGLLMRTMWTLQAVDPGFRTDSAFTVQTALPWDKYSLARQRTAFYSRVLAGVRSLPGVSAAAYITVAPMTWGGGIWPVGMRGAPVIRDDNSTASLRFTTPGYFSTIGIPLRRGRDIQESDDTTRPFVAVVSESFVKRYWPNEDPLGKHFGFAFHDRTVVGIVGNVRNRGLERPSEPQVYLPVSQAEDSSLIFYAPKDLIIRSAVPLPALLPSVRRIVRGIDPEQPISAAQTMSNVVADQTASRVAQLRVLGVLAIVALLLAGIGIHGLLAFAVSSRTQEIGVRLALGARSATIARMLLGEGLLLAGAGIVPGVAIAYAGGRAMQSLLIGVDPWDGPTVLGAVVLCVVTTLMGCLRPAIRAARVDPIAALRSD
ncbi:MAG: ABC transporter permease [Gemmatimonadaceae bacterium]